jgi:hypothetical protein
MPKSTKRRASRKTRKNLLSRKNNKKQGRKGRRRPQANAPAIISNSLFALTLNPVPGIVVESNKTLDGNTSKLYSDLVLCYYKLNPEVGVIPKLPDDSHPIEYKLASLVDRIKRALDKNFGFNIDYIKKRYCLSIYHRCHYPDYLPSMQVGLALLKVKKENPRLHKLFLAFLKTLINVTLIDTWFDSNFEYARDMFEDNIHQLEHDEGLDPEWITGAKAELDLYKKGDAFQYEKLLERSKRNKRKMDITPILKAANRFNSVHPLIKVIKKGCEIIEPRYTMLQYAYEPDLEEDDERDSYTLEFTNRAMIFWSYGGNINEEYDEWINCQANEGGIKEPICRHTVYPNQNADFDLKAFNEMCRWPSRLAVFFDYANDLLNKYSSERFKKYSKK